MPVKDPAIDWWPEWMSDLGTEDPLASDPVVVAEIEPTHDYQPYRHSFAALAPLRHLKRILAHPGSIGHDVGTSGPNPMPNRDKWDYAPRFWIAAAGLVTPGLEPLVVSWQSANRTVLCPDQGFLMTYGLVPRHLVVEGESPDIHWDDPATPRPDVVIVRSVSSHSSGAHTGARVSVARDFLQDYSTIRDQAIVQVYFAERAGPLSPDLRQILGGESHIELRLPGRLLDIRLLPAKQDPSVLVQIWGVRLLIKPGDAPISSGRWNYDGLTWPGIGEPVAKQSLRRLGAGHSAFVRDDVLGHYEGQPGFTIHPESGGVSYGSQWSVSRTRRVGRDLIALDLKKLYEGVTTDVVRRWHQYAVPPPADPWALDGVPNVGTRARQIVYGMAALGGALEYLAAFLIVPTVTSSDLAGLARRDLDYSGWWTASQAERVARHIPRELTEEQFLARCKELNNLVAEGLSRRHLRRMLVKLDVPEDDVKDFASLALLDRLLRLAAAAHDAGLHLVKNSNEVRSVAALADKAPSQIAPLFALNDLRQLDGHRAGKDAKQKLRTALAVYGLDPAAYRGGWGLALDSVYDRIAKTIETATETLGKSVEPL